MLKFNGWQKAIIILGLLDIVILGFMAFEYSRDGRINWPSLVLAYFLISIIAGIAVYVFQVQSFMKRKLMPRVLVFLVFIAALIAVTSYVASNLDDYEHKRQTRSRSFRI